jgi:hypothetical protein
VSTLFDQLRIVGGGFLCGAAFMIIILALGGVYSY